MEIEIYVLYSHPVLVADTILYLDNQIILQFTGVSLTEYPPILGKKTVEMQPGKHKLRITEKNFKKEKEFSFKSQEKSYIKIIISETSITFTQSQKQQQFK